MLTNDIVSFEQPAHDVLFPNKCKVVFLIHTGANMVTKDQSAFL